MLVTVEMLHEFQKILIKRYLFFCIFFLYSLWFFLKAVHVNLSDTLITTKLLLSLIKMAFYLKKIKANLMPKFTIKDKSIKSYSSHILIHF